MGRYATSWSILTRPFGEVVLPRLHSLSRHSRLLILHLKTYQQCNTFGTAIRHYLPAPERVPSEITSPWRPSPAPEFTLYCTHASTGCSKSGIASRFLANSRRQIRIRRLRIFFQSRRQLSNLRSQPPADSLTISLPYSACDFAASLSTCPPSRLTTPLSRAWLKNRRDHSARPAIQRRPNRPASRHNDFMVSRTPSGSRQTRRLSRQQSRSLKTMIFKILRALSWICPPHRR